ncbi:MAG: hypothetical protein WEB31_02155 [Chthoniobacterales bacterium]
MNDSIPTENASVSTEQRDRLLRRLIAAFALAAAVALVAAIGTSIASSELSRVDFAQQQMSHPAVR